MSVFFLSSFFPLCLFLLLLLNLEGGRDRNTILSRGCTDTSAFHFFPSVCVTKFLFFASPLSTFLTPPPWPSCFSTSLFPVFFSSSSSSSSSLFLGRFFYTRSVADPRDFLPRRELPPFRGGALQGLYQAYRFLLADV